MHRTTLLKLISGLCMLGNMSASCLRIGHRGACGYAPENTMRSFQKALELDVDMIELDVYCCASGEIVVIHDDTLDRTTNGTGTVEEKTLDELKRFDAGEGQDIPLLTEVFDCIARRAIINIELKGKHTAQPVADLIRHYVDIHQWSFDDFVVSSFDHHELLLYKQLMPEVRIGMLFEHIPFSVADCTNVYEAAIIGIAQECVSQDLVNLIHAHNMKVYVFTVNDVDAIAYMNQLGVDGIFSDYPDRVT